VKKHCVYLICICLFGVVWRLYCFAGFVMGDDPAYADYVLSILNGSYPSLCDTCVFSFRPVLLLSTAACMKLFGWNQFSFVLPILLCSVATIPVVYLLGKQLFDGSAGLVAAFLLAVYPLNVSHATTMTNDIMLSFLIALSALFFMQAMAGSGRKALLCFMISGVVLGLAMGVKINSAAVIVLFCAVFLFDGIKRRAINRGALLFFAAWGAVQGVFFLVYQLKTGNPFAHLQAEFIFNNKYIASGYDGTWHQVKNILLYYPRYMFCFLAEGHQGYRFHPYGYFYYVFAAAVAFLVIAKERPAVFPLVWAGYLFAVMEFSPLKLLPVYQPIHRLPRFLEILTVPVVLLIGLCITRAWKQNVVSRVLCIAVVAALTASSLYEAHKKSFFYRDSIRDGKRAYEFVKDRAFPQVITDQEMKNLLLFHSRFSLRSTLKSFEYNQPRYQQGSLLIFGGSRRQDMPPSYTGQFYPRAHQLQRWKKVIEFDEENYVWRPRDLVVYEVVRPGQPEKGPYQRHDHLKTGRLRRQVMSHGFTRVVDEVDVGSRQSEYRHGYRIVNQTWHGSRTFSYPGGKRIEDDGRGFKGHNSFMVRNCRVNKAMKIIKRVDAGVVPQQSKVYINNNLAGVWRIARDGRTGNWRDAAFTVPGRFVTAEDISVREEYLSSPVDINVFFYLFLQPK